ncbi:uncharacterized protein [Venturia canescens]|uniref:uncharacterized protein isoform X2 n=1 Tax=Venturia canescens TaxID=32260 RepID=UPI001C9CC3A9|nr:uncharacterized protein LOC122416712 isoform X2 [Venturia canescens]
MLVYNSGCYPNYNGIAGVENQTLNKHEFCSVENLKDDVKYTLKLPRQSLRSTGLLEVKFSLPSTKCNYEVALLVNSSITNDKDCKNHEFHKSNAYDELEVHSEEKTICVSSLSNGTNEHNCLENQFSMWYRHVFTGCYALRFTVDGYNYAILGRQFILTNYNRKEVAEPKFRCHYDDGDLSKQELVTFAVSISVHAGTAGMILTLTPMSYQEDAKDNACVQYGEDPLYTWQIGTDESAIPSDIGKNCRVTTVHLDNETSTRDTECKFDLRLSRKLSYCLEIEIEDDRCSRQTLWDPPPDGRGGKPACTWLQRCTRILKDAFIVEHNGLLPGSNGTDSVNDENTLLVPISLTVVIVMLALTTTILYVCHTYLKNSTKPTYVNANLKLFQAERNNCDLESVETTDEEILQKSTDMSEKEDKNEPIVLLYARGTNSFMNLMKELRQILETHCGCRVRDWYDANEWDEVARIGPSAWVAELLEGKYRALWIDTKRARRILDAQWRNNYLGNSIILKSDQTDEAVSDFRDAALPTVLDKAKRNVTTLEYNKHFVVRLESLDNGTSRQQDPFEDLSPHTRYLITHNLKDLCFHLTSSSTIRFQERLLDAEQLRVRELVKKMERSLEIIETLH